MRASVSNLDAFLEWRDDPDADLPALIARLKYEGPTEPMLRGRAFAKCLQAALEGDSETLSADGYTFAFTGDFTIEGWARREESREKDYGGLIVPARCDRVLGNTIVDDKTTEYFDAERYLDKYQWRYYLDMFGANRFQWLIWEVKEMKDEPQAPLLNGGVSKAFCVHKLHKLEAYRYERMEADCHALAKEFKHFAVGTLGWND